MYLIVSASTANARARVTPALDAMPRLHAMLQVVTTFLLICVTWVFFRARSIPDALYILGHMKPIGVAQALAPVPGGATYLLMSTGLIAVMLVLEFSQGGRELGQYLAARRWPVRWAVVYAICLLIVLFGKFQNQQAFIYFQF